MRLAPLVLLFVTSRAVVCGTNQSSTFDVDAGRSCEDISYPGHLQFSPEQLAESTPLRDLVNTTAHALADLVTTPAWAVVAERASAVLQGRPDVAVTVVTLSSLGALAYRRGPGVHAVALHVNQTAGVVQYVRSAGEARPGGHWAAPFMDCLSGQWVYGYTIAASNKQRATVGVYRYIDRCNSTFDDAFGGGHECDEDTTQCVASGASYGYTCECRVGFFDNSSADGQDEHKLRCQPCPGACGWCDSNGQCLTHSHYAQRVAVLSVQALCMGTTVALAIVVFRKRKCKTIATGMWTILETILLGIFILYGTVLLRFLNPTVDRCLFEPWCREIGFVICYGAIILKLYRILIEFRTRKAHRWVVRDKDLLKYLLGMFVMVVGYMAAFTAATLNFIQEGYNVMTVGWTPDGQRFLECKPLWWDYVTQTGEILILIFGIHLSFACRNATTQFQERRFLCLAIVVEALVSGAFYVLRALYSEALHPDVSYMAYFVRSQLTSTVVLALIFIPKLWYQHKQVTDSRGAHSYLTQESTRIPIDAFKTGDGGVQGSNNSEADVGDINLADMNPEDIRAELKRLYTQLEVLKNKTIRTDNPHISKRRGGRKVAHRRFSLQKKGSREKALHHRHQRHSTRRHGGGDHDGVEGEVSRTPEDSVCSIEGPSAIYTDGPSTYSEMAYNPGASYRGAATHKQ